jgi:hypothetical protein
MIQSYFMLMVVLASMESPTIEEIVLPNISTAPGAAHFLVP